MATLADRDVRAVRDLAHRLVDAPLGEVIDPAFLDDLCHVVPADYAEWAELDLDGHHILTEVSLPVGLSVDEATFWEVVPEHPVCAYRQRTGDFSAVRYTDCTTMEELRLTHYYEVAVLPHGLNRHINVAIPSPRSHAKSLCLERQGRDFNERDRAVLDLLIPQVEARLHAIALQRMLDKLQSARPGHAQRDRLTSREQEVMGLVSIGCTNAEVARALSITPLTVRKHLENVFAKLGVHNRTAAVAATRRRSGWDAAPA